MIKIIVSVVFILLSANIFASDVELLHSDEWLLPKQAKTLLEMPAIHKSMQKLRTHIDSSLQLKYPGGDEGTLWVNELRSWLVALGLSSKRIKLIQGSAISTTIEFEVLPSKANANILTEE